MKRALILLWFIVFLLGLFSFVDMAKAADPPPGTQFISEQLTMLQPSKMPALLIQFVYETQIILAL